jgi:Uma2 family endonuclease
MVIQSTEMVRNVAMLTLVTPTDSPVLLYGKRQGEWTAEDWEALPEDDNIYEIIEGVLYMSTAPSHFHQYILKRLYRIWGIPAEDAGYVSVDFSPIGVILPAEEPVQPDLVAVRTERKFIIHDKRIRGVPDLIVEIVSPGNTSYDEEIKYRAYERAGIPEYGIIYPATRVLKLFRLNVDGRYVLVSQYSDRDSVSFACAPDISFVVGKLFEGAPDTTL